MSIKNAHVIKGILTGAQQDLEKKDGRRKGKRHHARLVVKEDKSNGKQEQMGAERVDLVMWIKKTHSVVFLYASVPGSMG